MGPQHCQAPPEAFLPVRAPYRDEGVVAVDGLFTCSWRAELWTQAGMPCVRGHARDMHAIHGGQAKHAPLDAQTSARLWRGGMLSPAEVSPAALRATRDLLRRRMPCRRHRATWLTPVQHTNSQDHRPEIGTQMADTAHRGGGAERFPDPAVPNRIEVDRALPGSDDDRLRDRA